MKNNTNKKSLKVLDLSLIIVGISTFVFTIIMLVFFALFQAIPDTLCERFFTCIVGELGITGLIQVVKTICSNFKKQNTENDVNLDMETNTETELESEENVYG